MNRTAPPKIGIIRDDRFLEHRTGLTHPEHPNRLLAVHRMLDTEFPTGLIPVKPRLATLEELELVHTPAYIDKVMATSQRDFSNLAPDTTASRMTYMAAFLAVGACLAAVDSLMAEKVEACLALVRPPGHHAQPDRAEGFCIFNNLGVAARYALAKYKLDRVLIVDFDIHHGNGLQDLFYTSDRVLYFSSHYVHSYPYKGAWSEVGEGPGKGYTVNLSLERDSGDEDLLHLYREVLGPILRRWRPQLILCAAGFDGHVDDPLGRTKFSSAVYGWLTRLIWEASRASGSPPILFSLEGGYKPPALAASVRELLFALTISDSSCYYLPTARGQKGAQMVRKARLSHAKLGVWFD